jgi:hypothetical protein
MKHLIKPGAQIDIPSLAEIQGVVRQSVPNVSYIRASQNVVLDGTGSGIVSVYECPMGMEFMVQRILVDLDTAAGPNDGNVLLNVAGRSVQYLRSDTRIEYGNPASAAGVPSIPGAQSWGAMQGPYIRNGEAFQVLAHGLTAGAVLAITVSGELRKPASADTW